MVTRSALPQAYHKQISSLIDFANLTGWTVIGDAVISLETTEHGQSMRCDGAGTIHLLKEIGLSDVPYIGFWFYVDSAALLNDVQLAFGDGIGIESRLIGNPKKVWNSTANTGYLTGQKFTALAGSCDSIVLNAATSGNMKVAIYTDNNNYPGALLAYSASVAVEAGDNTLELNVPVSMDDGGTYWIVFTSSNPGILNRIAYDTDQTGLYICDIPGWTYADAFPSTYPSGSNVYGKRDYAVSGWQSDRYGSRIAFTPILSNSSSSIGVQSGWNYICVPVSAFGALTGSCTNIRLTIDAISAVVVKICGIHYLSTQFMPRVMIDFDNGYDSVIDLAFPILEEAGFVAGVGVNSQHVGSTIMHYTVPYTRMTESELGELYEAGWDLNNHSKTHPSLGALTYAQNITEIGDCQTWLEERGFLRGARHLVLPSGTFTQNATIAAAQELGVLSIRRWKLNTYIPSGYYTVPVMMLGCIGSHDYTNGITAAQVCAYIDESQRCGGAISLCFHALKERIHTDYDTTPDNFQLIVDHLKNIRAKVVTRSEFYHGLTNPRYQSLPVGRSPL